ncbi:MAG: hypothetical protein M3O46_05315 [Myxococcota bacterium]|nr:hypothetical protein [Myxococcota bacterium]
MRIAVPHARDALAQRVASGSEVHPHRFAVPPPPQVFGAAQPAPQALQLVLLPSGVHVPPQQALDAPVQLPQSTVPPQPSGAGPQWMVVPQACVLDFGTQLHWPVPSQCDAPPVVVVQTWAQPPQLLSSVLRLTQAPLQVSGVAPEHAMLHALPLHTALPVPLLGPEHDLHAPPAAPVPHSVMLCAVVTHPWLPQHPAEHVVLSHATHVPLWQIWLVPQDWPSRT